MDSNKTLILLRGLPGSGKSTFANAVFQANALFSIDDYFTDPVTGKYQFDHKENYKAYTQCEQSVKDAMRGGNERVVVHNTFVSAEELQPYFVLAEQFSYKVFVLTVESYHSGINVHNISDEQIKKMAEKYRVKLY